ncbi:uncharacterized protein LOC131162393 isoform X1 [Malania oleifera]|uniref:uncharacterized protein LOC131162393 isoform X1 n=1 Tax=Malania oleifera TaxID=397392 RepID=UPI0025AEAF86|nr:uncharacterized protein LOC131162393 isoform X1 [Malania oleifera]
MSPPGDGACPAAVGRCTCFSGDNEVSNGDARAGSDDLVCAHCARSGVFLSSSSFSSCFDLAPYGDWEKFRRIVTASVKGFAIGTGLKGGLALFSVLTRLRRRRLYSSAARKAGMVTNSEAVVMAVKETLRYGVFLGTFSGTFVSVDETIAALGGHRRTARWRSLLAGAIAGPSMLLTGTNTQHTSLAIYILMRAAVLASRCGIKSRRFGRICKPLTWAHGDIFLMCLSSSQILSAYILKQESLPPSYKSFLNKHGGKDISILEGVKSIASGMPFTNLDTIENYYKGTGVNIKLDPKMKVPCSIVHGNQSCSAHAVSFFIEAYKRSIPVYLPVYLFPALIVHRQGLLKMVSVDRLSFQLLGIEINSSEVALHYYQPSELPLCWLCANLRDWSLSHFVCLKHRMLNGLTQFWGRVLLVLQDQAYFYPYIHRLPGCGRVCSSGFLGDVTFQWWQWGRSQLGWPWLLRRKADGLRYRCTALLGLLRASSLAWQMLDTCPRQKT